MNNKNFGFNKIRLLGRNLSKGVFNKPDCGFTLIELIITIAVLSILSALTLAIINPIAQVQKANDARRKSDLAQIQRALEQYYQDNGRYPKSSSSSDPNPYSIVNLQNQSLGWGSSWSPYMNLLPKDPESPNKTYVYYASSDGQSYWLYASLDRGAQDAQACSNGGPCNSLGAPPGNSISYNQCGGVCNFGVSSPNQTP